MKKNDEFELYIEDMSVDGAGIGHKDGMTFFVKDAVVGDTITAGVTKLKKTYGYARLISVDRASPDRVVPACEASKICGGCTMMALSYEKQLEVKERQVRNAIQRIAGIHEQEMERAKRPIVGMEDPFRFRNKAQYPVGEDAYGNIVIGYYAAHSHRIVECSDCKIGQDGDAQIRKILKKYMREQNVRPYNEKTGTGSIRHLLIRYGLYSGQVMVCVVSAVRKLPGTERLIAALRNVPGMTSVVMNINTRKDNVILGDETVTLWGEDRIRDTLNGVEFMISAKSFYQVNPRQTEKLYAKAVEYAAPGGHENVWDLYCGIGTMTLLLAKCAKHVYGVEAVPEAIADAKENARHNGIENVTFVEGKAEEVLKDAKLITRPDVIVIDPPRKGCDEACLSAMLSAAPGRIVYISCNPSTLARDLKMLTEGGYRLEEYTPFDQFGHSMHVETVVLMSRVKD